MSSQQNNLPPIHPESSERSCAVCSSPDDSFNHSTASGPLRARVAQRRGIPEVSELVLACRHHLMLTSFLSIVVATGFAFAAWTMIDASYQADGLVRVREKQT